MTADVLNSELDGQKTDNREFGRFFNNLITGGIETTRNTLAWAMTDFVAHPDQYRRMQEDLSLGAECSRGNIALPQPGRLSAPDGQAGHGIGWEKIPKAAR